MIVCGGVITKLNRFIVKMLIPSLVYHNSHGFVNAKRKLLKREHSFNFNAIEQQFHEHDWSKNTTFCHFYIQVGLLQRTYLLVVGLSMYM